MPSQAADAARRAAATSGMLLDDETAERVAAAVLSSHDGSAERRVRFNYLHWEQPEAREQIRSQMRVELLTKLPHDVVPAGPVKEELFWVTTGFPGLDTAPLLPFASRPVEHAEPWWQLEVVLSVPTRRTPPGRCAT